MKTTKSLKTLAVVERERERERERENLFIQRGIRLLDHTHTHVYCHLENKKRKLNSSKNKGRTMPVKQVIGLPLCAFDEKVKHNHRRGGP